MFYEYLALRKSVYQRNHPRAQTPSMEEAEAILTRRSRSGKYTPSSQEISLVLLEE